jgi:hypothetical protein
MGGLAFEGASAAGKFLQQRPHELRRVGDDVVVGHRHERRGGVGLHRDDQREGAFNGDPL